uniref:C3H1-type domain-containing protein n=1 Tax=viral metagenome TaxID=1070528 RepID=A0A6C0H7R1_9ZZZZ
MYYNYQTPNFHPQYYSTNPPLQYKKRPCANILKYNSCNDKCTFAHPSDPKYLNILYKDTNLTGDSVSVYINQTQMAICPKFPYLKSIIKAIGYEKNQLYKKAYDEYKNSIILIDEETSNIDCILLKRDINHKIEQFETIPRQENIPQYDIDNTQNINNILVKLIKDSLNIKEIILNASTDEELKKLVFNNLNIAETIKNLIKTDNEFNLIVKKIIKELLNDEELLLCLKDILIKLPEIKS